MYKLVEIILMVENMYKLKKQHYRIKQTPQPSWSYMVPSKYAYNITKQTPQPSSRRQCQYV